MNELVSSKKTVQNDIASHLRELPAETFHKLYREPATCLAVFRLLPQLSKQLVMRMLYLRQPVTTDELQSWCQPTAYGFFENALDHAQRLQFLDQQGDMWHLNTTFREEFQNALTGRGPATSFGSLAEGTDSHSVDVAFLDNYAKTGWESVLQFMVGQRGERNPHPAVLNILEKSGLMERTGLLPADLVITHSGFQFLLQDINSQVWALLLQYLSMVKDLGMEEDDVLNFIFFLSSLELGSAYSTEVLTETQATVLMDMVAFGIVYRRKKKSKRFYPTRLATTLTNGKAAIRQTESEQEGYILLETNYRLYAYTTSELQIAILKLFVDITFRFPTFVMGVITRESIERALKKNITAEQIIQYLTTNAHPLMRKTSPILPLTVVDQIRLWEMDMNRFTVHAARHVWQFPTRDEYETLRNYAKSINGLLACSDTRWWLVIKAESFQSVATYTRRIMEQRRARKSRASGAPGSAAAAGSQGSASADADGMY
ncbi:transcription factor tfb2 [Allomyces macrogynus ATCC 38327]|uniref:RNA polymerase II transcription factor B subunit 2 n=1 Tax=Allomyces macrogynus (strain ATCC 38327) TaxID=578462 RepID=A0A0L0SDK9_ALLM3|nr:transcription factor tfb2 [Allomyces macrogynus ATCC 38327]|eukprot:KNE60571.1 transcription factor tfb2 [Allomyces macrogynus ATCC 38327]